LRSVFSFPTGAHDDVDQVMILVRGGSLPDGALHLAEVHGESFLKGALSLPLLVGVNDLLFQIFVGLTHIFKLLVRAGGPVVNRGEVAFSVARVVPHFEV